MNKDIEDALEFLLSKLVTQRTELDAIAAQYFLKEPQLIEAVEKISTDIGNIIRDIERLLPL